MLFHQDFMKLKKPAIKTGVKRSQHTFNMITVTCFSPVFRGVRPFGVSLLVAGWDDDRPYLFQSDPSVSSSVSLDANQPQGDQNVINLPLPFKLPLSVVCLLEMSIFKA